MLTPEAELLAANEVVGSNLKFQEKYKKKLAKQLLDYVAMYPDTVIRFKRSDMILYIHSDAAYLVLPKAGCSLPATLQDTIF